MTFTRCLGPFPLPGQGCPARGMGYNQPSALYLIRTTDALRPQAVRLLAPRVLPVHTSAVLWTPGILSPSGTSLPERSGDMDTFGIIILPQPQPFVNPLISDPHRSLHKPLYERIHPCNNPVDTQRPTAPQRAV